MVRIGSLPEGHPLLREARSGPYLPEWVSKNKAKGPSRLRSAFQDISEEREDGPSTRQ